MAYSLIVCSQFLHKYMMNAFLASPGLSVNSFTARKERIPSHLVFVGQYSSMSGSFSTRGGVYINGGGGPYPWYSLGTPETRMEVPGGIFSKNSSISIVFSVFVSPAIEYCPQHSATPALS